LVLAHLWRFHPPKGESAELLSYSELFVPGSFIIILLRHRVSPFYSPVSLCISLFFLIFLGTLLLPQDKLAMPSSSQALLLGAFLQCVTGMDLAHAAQRNHARDIPTATSMPAPFAFMDELNLFAGHSGLQARQEATTTSSLVVTIAPSNTCGYLSGMPGVAITCENLSSCSWATVSTLGTTSGLVGCDSEIYITCVESSKAVDPAACDDLCQSNTFYLRW
jgi:hypothetical protein